MQPCDTSSIILILDMLPLEYMLEIVELLLCHLRRDHALFFIGFLYPVEERLMAKDLQTLGGFYGSVQSLPL